MFRSRASTAQSSFSSHTLPSHTNLARLSSSLEDIPPTGFCTITPCNTTCFFFLLCHIHFHFHFRIYHPSNSCYRLPPDTCSSESCSGEGVIGAAGWRWGSIGLGVESELLECGGEAEGEEDTVARRGRVTSPTNEMYCRCDLRYRVLLTCDREYECWSHTEIIRIQKKALRCFSYPAYQGREEKGISAP